MYDCLFILLWDISNINKDFLGYKCMHANIIQTQIYQPMILKPGERRF